MALINCIECTKSISDLAETCPHCGAPVKLSLKTSGKKSVINCFECDSVLKEGVEMCPNCGVKQSLNINKTTSEKQIQIKKTIKEVPIIESDLKNENKSKEKKVIVPLKSENIKERIIIQQMPKKSHWFRNLIIFLGILLALGYVGFKILPNDVQRNFIKEVGLEDSNFISTNSMSSYIEISEVVPRKTMFGKWGITGVLGNIHPTKTVYSVTIRYSFSDGDEDRTKNIKIKKNGGFKIFDEKIDGHKGASFYGAKVIDAN